VVVMIREQDVREQEVRRLQETWERHGQSDPLWAILTDPGKRGGRWEPGSFFATGREEVGQLMARLGSLPERRERALDFGCGVGRLTEALADHFSRVDGVDISEAMIGRARTLSRHRAACAYHANARPDLSLFPDACFDLVHSSIVLQHVGRVLAGSYLRELVRVLRPGGVLHFQLPTTPRWNPGGIAVRVAPRALLERARGMRMDGIPEGRVRALLAGLGLEVLEVAPDDSAGHRWQSRRYTATRPDSIPSRS
jgi:SAM-dependent methyltransferase